MEQIVLTVAFVAKVPEWSTVEKTHAKMVHEMASIWELVDAQAAWITEINQTDLRVECLDHEKLISENS